MQHPVGASESATATPAAVAPLAQSRGLGAGAGAGPRFLLLVSRGGYPAQRALGTKKNVSYVLHVLQTPFLDSGGVCVDGMDGGGGVGFLTTGTQLRWPFPFGRPGSWRARVRPAVLCPLRVPSRSGGRKQTSVLQHREVNTDREATFITAVHS